MKRIRLPVIIFIVVVIIAAGIWWLVSWNSSKVSQSVSTTGFIEATDVTVAAETGGRIVAINADEGDDVTAGQPLLRLDDSLLSKQREQASATVRLVVASMNQAMVYREGSEQQLKDAQDVRDNPLQLDSQIAAARKQVELAELDLLREKEIETELNVPAAEVKLDTAQRVLDNLETYGTVGKLGYYEMQKLIIPAEGDVSLSELNLAYLRDFQTRWRIPAAQTRRDMAQEALDNLLAISENPQDIKAVVTRAEAGYYNAVAAVAVAESQVEQAEAALAVVDAQIGKLTIDVPLSGIVAARYAEVGEVAQPGAPLLKIIALDEVQLTAYVPESKIGLVSLGQSVAVYLDSFPGETFTGTIVFISPEAIFTPGNIQIKEEREKTVFPVKINLENPRHKLKPGMPADVTIPTANGS